MDIDKCIKKASSAKRTCPRCGEELPNGIKKPSLAEGQWLLICCNKVCDYEKIARIPLLFRFHRGSLKPSLETVVEIESQAHLLEHINANWSVPINKVDIKFYIKDVRLDWDTYLVSSGVFPQAFYPIGFLNRKPDWDIQ